MSDSDPIDDDEPIPYVLTEQAHEALAELERALPDPVSARYWPED